MARRRPRLTLAAGTCAYFLLGADCGGFPVYEQPDAPFVPFDAGPRTLRTPDLDEDFAAGGVVPIRFWDKHFLAVDRTPHGGGLGLSPDLAIDGEGTFHVVHCHADTNEVLYTRARPGEGPFHTEHVGVETVELGATTGASIVVGIGGTVHVAYAHDAGLGVVHALRDAHGVWSLGPLPFDVGPEASEHPAIALDPRDGPFVVGVMGGVPSDAPREWAIGVASDGRAPDTIGEIEAASIALSALRTGSVLHAAASSRGGATDITLLATRTDGGAWSTRRLDGTQRLAMAEGVDGTLHVVTVRAVAGGVAVSHAVGPADDTSRVETLLFTHTAVLSIDLAIAPSGALHLAFTDPSSLVHATDASGVWRLVEVDRLGGEPSLAVDRDGVPWIAYRDALGSLVVATPHAS